MRRLLLVCFGTTVVVIMAWVLLFDRYTEVPPEDPIEAPVVLEEETPSSADLDIDLQKQSDLVLRPPKTSDDLDPKLRDIEPPEFHVTVLDSLEPIGGTWGETFDLLIDRVERGDSNAQYQLAMAARRCVKGPRTDAELEKSFELVAASGNDAQGNFVLKADAIAARRERGLSILEFCRDSPLDELNHFPMWIEMAAESGNSRAMLEYGAAYPGDDDLDASNEDDLKIINDRTLTYVDYLEQAKSEGSIDAMMLLTSIYLQRDTVDYRKEAFANLYAYAWYRFRFEGDDGSFKYLREIGFAMDPRDYYESVSLGKQILESQNCCFKIPEL